MSEQEFSMERLQAILEQAMAAVDAAAVPDELRAVAFSKAVDVIIAHRRAGPPARIEVGSAGPAANASPGHRLPATSDMIGSIAQRLRLDREIVVQVFDETDGKIDIVVPPRKLATGKAPATKQLALLVAAARQAAQIDEWTDADEIRRVAEEFKKYDQSNFAATLKQMDGEFQIKRSGRSIKVRLSRPGWDQAAELVTKLTGEE